MSGSQGCVTDVALQKELLIHRFGFNPNDILILTDETEQKPIRANIIEAFENHLIEQAKPGDVVVFHFSGHGSRVIDPNPIHEDDLNSTFVPTDASSDRDTVPDIMGRTLFLLMSALQTENVTAVLDCCYSGGGTRGNVRIRSARGGSRFKPSDTELEYQKQWLEQLSLDEAEFNRRRSIGVAKGVVIASAQRHQESADMSFNGFNAGAFTYLLTQYLWQKTQGAENTVVTLTPSIKQLAGQTPLTDVQPKSSKGKEPIYFIDRPSLAAEAIVKEIKANQVTVWLGGLARESLREGIRFSFDVVNKDGEKLGQAELKSREGLLGQGTIQGTVELGALLRETARTIPKDLKLRIGLDPSLGADTALAQQLIQSLRRVEAVPFQPGNTPYAGQIDYILSPMTPSYRQDLQQQNPELPEVGSIGMFSQSLSEVIPRSFGQPGEKVEEAIARLNTKLKSLLAARIVKQTLNGNSSQLNLTASMLLPKQRNEILAQAFTVRGNNRPPEPSEQTLAPKLPVNQPFQFQIKNQGSEPLYISVLSIDSGGEILVLFPPGPLSE
ncbi:MAG: caspase family protein [Xenococcaceae cyanobacterium]